MFPGDTLYSSDAAKAVNFGEPPSVLLLQFQIIKKTIIQRKGLEFHCAAIHLNHHVVVPVANVILKIGSGGRGSFESAPSSTRDHVKRSIALNRLLFTDGPSPFV